MQKVFYMCKLKIASVFDTVSAPEDFQFFNYLSKNKENVFLSKTGTELPLKLISVFLGGLSPWLATHKKLSLEIVFDKSARTLDEI
jgi:hypothetical protein